MATSTKHAGIHFALLICGIGVLVSNSAAQSCDLRVSAFSSTRNDPSTMQQSTGTVEGQLYDFSVSTRAGKKALSASAGPSDGYALFESLKPGYYQLTLRKSGYQGAIYSVKHSCKSDGQDWVSYLRLWRGNSKTIATHPARLPIMPANTPKVVAMRAEVRTILGDSDTSGNIVERSVTTSPRTLPKTLSGGVLNGKATSLPKPAYPAAARAVKASGAVSVQVLVGLEGNVLSASAVSGHPLLRAAAVSAARGAKFSPTLLSGQPVKISGVIVYNFVP